MGEGMDMVRILGEVVDDGGTKGSVVGVVVVEAGNEENEQG
jgi:hypothetical protein